MITSPGARRAPPWKLRAAPRGWGSDRCRILDRAKAPLPPEWAAFGLDEQGIRWVLQLSIKVAEHVWFEKRNEVSLRRDFMETVKRYREV
jgi:hypothetical protein